jgi:hypothetical protein
MHWQQNRTKNQGGRDDSKRKSTHLGHYNGIFIVGVFRSSGPQMAGLAERRCGQNHPIFKTAVHGETVEGNDTVALCAELVLGRATPFSQASAARELHVGKH